MRILAVSLLLTVGQLYAQVDTGVILGTVADQSGAVIPGAPLGGAPMQFYVVLTMTFVPVLPVGASFASE